MIKILIADDHPLVREGLKKTLKAETGMSVVCEAGNAHELLLQLQKHEVDVVVMDLSMPGNSGLDVLKEIKERFPKLPVLILSMHPEDRFAVRSIRAGAAGYLTKESAPQELVKAIERVAQGGKYITVTVAERLAFDIGTAPKTALHDALSDREFQIFRLIASGKSIKEIAEELFLSESSIRTYRNRILEKMDLHSDVELAQYAVRNRLVE
jgi:two-component system invasion response regulator UvrY